MILIRLVVVQHISNAHANFQPHSMFSDGEKIILLQCMLLGSYAVKHYRVDRSDYLNTFDFLDKLAENLRKKQAAQANL